MDRTWEEEEVSQRMQSRNHNRKMHLKVNDHLPSNKEESRTPVLKQRTTWHQMLSGKWTRVKYCIHMMFSSCSDTKAAEGHREKCATLSKERSVLNI